MIKAKNLIYAEVMRALEQGNFYASQGPLIHELYVEDQNVHIKCSPVKYIAMSSEHRPFGGIRIAKEGEYLTEAVFQLPTLGQKYIRFDVMDERGQHANTRGYFLDEIGKHDL